MKRVPSKRGGERGTGNESSENPPQSSNNDRHASCLRKKAPIPMLMIYSTPTLITLHERIA